MDNWPERLGLGPDSFLYEFEGKARMTASEQISVLLTVVPDEARIEVSAFPCFDCLIDDLLIDNQAPASSVGEATDKARKK